MTRFGKTLVTLAALAIGGTAIYASGVQMPNVPSIGIPSGIPTASKSPPVQKGSIVRRNTRGDICQLGEDCRPPEIKGLPPLSRIGGDR